MKSLFFLASAILLASPLLAAEPAAKAAQQQPPNPHIDYDGFLKDAATVGKLREQRRVSEDDFIRMATEPGTIVFDARSDDKYDLIHIAGAQHLALTDATADDLAKVLPDKDARILIYCNNNFDKEPVAFATKSAPASLNIYTFNTLYSYGYRNVYELGPFVDIHKSKLSFSGTLAEKLKLKTE